MRKNAKIYKNAGFTPFNPLFCRPAASKPLFKVQYQGSLKPLKSLKIKMTFSLHNPFFTNFYRTFFRKTSSCSSGSSSRCWRAPCLRPGACFPRSRSCGCSRGCAVERWRQGNRGHPLEPGVPPLRADPDP